MLKRLEDTSIKPSPDFSQLRKVLLREGKPDHVPFYELFVNTDSMERLLGKKIVDRAETVEFYYRAGYDFTPGWPRYDFPTGSLIDTSSDYPIKDWETFESYPWPDLESISYAEFESMARVLPEGMKIIGENPGVFEMAECLVGYEEFCYLLMDDPALVEAIFERLTVLYESLYRNMADIEKVGAVVISDDLGFKTQTLIGADDLRKYVLPVHKKLAEIAHKAGKPVILHSCGQLAEIMEDVIEDVRIDAKHSYEDAILPVEEAKRLYGDRIAILGGFDLDRLCRSTENEVREHVREMVNDLGRDGGYALGSGNSIPMFVPVENYLAMQDEGWKLR